jgi:electron transfer flavoprotein alpha subunit
MDDESTETTGGARDAERPIVAVGVRSPEGAPDDDTDRVLRTLSPLGGVVHGVDLGSLLGEPTVAEAIAAIARQLGAGLVALPSGPSAEGVAGRIASQLRGVLALDVRGLSASPTGLTVRRPAYGGAFDAEIEVPHPHVLVASLDPASDGDGTPAAVERVHAVEPPPGAVRLVERRHDDRELPLSRARRVVAGGRGVGGPEGFTELAELAAALGGALAASRPPCDAGWVPGHHQVGITGARVAPELYVAVGISGSVQHRAGMQSSHTVVAINNDPEAPMLHHADLAVIGDWHEVVAGMLEVLSDGAEPAPLAATHETTGATR